MSNIVDRFLRYVKIDTESMHDVPTVPSTEKQLDLARLLQRELEEMGAENVYLGDGGIVYATIPTNCEKNDVPVVGFVAHIDTSPDAPGANVQARIVENYDGKDIVLNEKQGIVMQTAAYPHLLEYVGKDLIVTDGTTLLGADDKAGVAVLMNLAEYLLAHPEVKHGTIKLAFTPDEEVGSGVRRFDVAAFGADFAYTIDGPNLGEINSETFSAADAKIVVHGLSIHPGRAKNTMKNAILIAMELDSMLPAAERPQHTEGKEGFYHITDFDGSVSRTAMKYIIRDYDMDAFLARKARMQQIVDYLNGVYGEGTIELELTDTYYNMYEAIRPIHYIVDYVKDAMAEMGITPREIPVRGGTDGSQLTTMGLPCPNISAAYRNNHGVFEYLCIQDLEKNGELIIRLAKSFAEK